MQLHCASSKARVDLTADQAGSWPVAFMAKAPMAIFLMTSHFPFPATGRNVGMLTAPSTRSASN